MGHGPKLTLEYNKYQIMLQVRELTKKFGDKVAVNNISFSAKIGEIIGFLGPNGAGKTTTMRLITGFLTPTKGKITIHNFSPKEARNLIGYLPEENPLYSQFTPREYLYFIGKMHYLGGNYLKQRLNYVIDNCGLQEVTDQPIETLSRGYRQRVGLAAALIHDPQLLIMDEPTTGLDPNQQREIRQLIRKIAKNKTVIFSTHILSEAEAICQRIIIIHQGKIKADQAMSQIKKGRNSLERLFTQLTNERQKE